MCINVKVLILFSKQLHSWVTKDGTCSLPSEDDNCTLVTITEEDIDNVVKHVPKLDTLVITFNFRNLYT